MPRSHRAIEELLSQKWGEVLGGPSVPAPHLPPWPGDDVLPRHRAPRSGSWWDGFASPNPNGYVSSAVVFEDRVIIAGSFTSVGRRAFPGIAAWSGVGYETFGDDPSFRLDQLVVHDGVLYASRGSSLYRWTGSEWASSGGAAMTLENGYLTRMVSDGTHMLALGWFYDQADAWQEVWRYDGGSWSPLPGRLDGSVDTITLWNGEPWIAAALYSSDGSITHVARHDGNGWIPVIVSGGGQSPAYVTDLDGLSGELIAAGYFDSLSGVAARGVARWNGAAFEAVGALPQCGIHSVIVDDGQIVALGWFVFDDTGYGTAQMTWNGVEWIERRLDGDLLARDAFLFGGVPHALGDWNGAGDHGSGLLRDEGGSVWGAAVEWTGDEHGLAGGQVRDLVVWEGALWAAGSFRYFAQDGSWHGTHGVAAWNGSAWADAAAPDYSLVEDLLVHDGALYAAGSIQSPTFGSAGVALRSGGGWLYAAPWRSGIQKIAIYRNELYAFNPSYPSGPTTAVAVHRGGDWVEIGQDGPSSSSGSGVFFHAAAVHEDRLYVAGVFDRVGNRAAEGLARWDGTSWEPVPGMPSGEPRDLIVLGRDLIVAGRYQSPTGNVGLVRYDGTVGSGLVRGVADKVGSMAGGIVAYGSFQTGEGSGRVLFGTPGAWRVAHGNIVGGLNGVAGFHGSLFFGGWIQEVRDPFTRNVTPAAHLARFDPPVWRSRPAGPGILRVRAAGGIPSFTLDLDRGGPVRLDVHDVAGRRIDTVLDRPLGAGAHDVTWTARGVPPGVYFARLRHAAGEASARFVVLPSP